MDSSGSFPLLPDLQLETGSAAILAVAAAGFVVLLGLGFLLSRWRSAAADVSSLSAMTRGPRFLGYLVILLFFGGFGSWASIAPLSSAALAPGIVSPDGSRKTVQHLEGGIIRHIHVREGDLVNEGDDLVTLESTRALSRYQELQERQTYLIATEARLMAEQLGAEEVDYPPEIASGETGQWANLAMASQQALFSSRKETQRARERILEQRVSQIEEEIKGLEEVISAQEEQISLTEAEIESAEELVEEGLERLPRVLSLKRQLADIRATRAGNRATIAQNRQKIGETELQLLASRQQVREEASRELAEVRSEIATIRSQLPDRADVLSRTRITAPITGTVMNIQVTTETGGVIASGAPILDIVPDDTNLVIDARVKPIDIDSVHPGMRARVVLTAFNQRFLPQVFGKVRSVSADRLVDDRTGEPYFLAKVEVDQAELDGIREKIDLVAGMPVDVMILTGETTLATIMSRPIGESLRRSFRDN